LPLDVGAGAEARTVACEHDHACIADFGERRSQLGDQRGVKSVAPLRLGDRHAQHALVPLDSQRVHRPEHKVRQVIQGTLAAAVTPFREGGAALDEEAFGPLADFFYAAGLDGILAMGTTGEGILLSLPERKRVTDLFLLACNDRLDVAVNCGAQTTADTLALAEHAAAAGAAAVAVIAPPYFQLDDEALFAHLAAAAEACAPTPFYVYEFARVSGYAVPVGVVERLREVAPNLAGMKVSDAPFERLEPYLIEGLDIFVGAESLIGAGMRRGARGSVSALATAFPELVAGAVREPSPERSAHLGELREGLEAFPRHAALKRVLALRGVPVREDVRAPLRSLTDVERDRLDALVPDWLGQPSGERAAR
jgi:dihydrodipicolinate synthase/N-acetylneuraminate lyase